MIQFPKSNDDKSIAVIEFIYMSIKRSQLAAYNEQATEQTNNNNKDWHDYSHGGLCVHSRNAPLDRRKRK